MSIKTLNKLNNKYQRQIIIELFIKICLILIKDLIIHYNNFLHQNL